MRQYSVTPRHRRWAPAVVAMLLLSMVTACLRPSAAKADTALPRQGNYLARAIHLAEESRQAGGALHVSQFAPAHNSGVKLQAWRVTDRSGDYYALLLTTDAVTSEAGSTILAMGAVVDNHVNFTIWVLANSDATSPVIAQLSRSVPVATTPSDIGPGDLVCGTVGGAISSELPFVCAEAYPICRIATGALYGLIGTLACALSGASPVEDISWYALPRGVDAEADSQTGCPSCVTPYFLVEIFNLWGDPPCLPTSESSTCVVLEYDGLNAAYQGGATVYWTYTIDWPDGEHYWFEQASSRYTLDGGIDYTFPLNVPIGDYNTTITVSCVIAVPDDHKFVLGAVNCNGPLQASEGVIVDQWALT